MSTRLSVSAEAAQDLAMAVALQLLRPLARLMVAQGLKYGETAEVLKRAFVEVSKAELERAGSVANVSRISVSTGIHRQDVNRLLETSIEELDRGRSLASEVYTRWLTDPAYMLKGWPRELPVRAEPGQRSFEELARAISTDVHPRTLIEELRRLGLAQFDNDSQTLKVSPDGFVPIAERAGLLGLLGDNVGDHFSAAVSNVLGDLPRMLEQAVYADGLDENAVGEIDFRVRALWRDVMQVLVPLLNSLIAQGKKDAGEAAQKPTALNDSGQAALPVRRRIRVGMYMHAQEIQAESAGQAAKGAQGKTRKSSTRK